MNVSIRLSPSQVAKVDEAASQLGLDRGRWMRAVIYSQLAREGVPEPDEQEAETLQGPAAWITRRRTSVRHIRGLLRAFDNAGLDSHAEVRIYEVDSRRAVSLPNGAIVTQSNLPPEGILFVPDH